jgi:transmembrane 9 superfamily protein 2/4
MTAFYVYNHLRFIITYHEDATSFDGVRVTGFDVQPVSMQHNVSTAENLSATSKIATCNEPGAPDVVNNPYTYMALLTGPFGESVKVLYSYEVQWVSSDLPWADRWDVYLLRSR